MVDKKWLAILIIVKFGGEDGVNQLDKHLLQEKTEAQENLGFC